MGIVLDLMVLAIIILFCILSARKGFVKIFVEVAGFVAAMVLTFTISTPLAGATYDKIIEPPIISSVSKTAVNTSEAATQSVWDSLPDFVTKNADRLSLDSEQLSENVTDNMQGGVETAVEKASQEIIRPVVVKILGLVYSVVLMIVLLILVKLLAKLINKVFSFSVIGKANKFFGGVLGILKGAVIAIVFCMVISLIVSFTKNGFLIFTKDSIDSSYVFKFLTEIVPF